MYAMIKIVTMLAIFFGCILLSLWVFRPSSKKAYEKISKIPLKND